MNVAGHGARRRAEELRAEQSTLRRWSSAVLGIHTEERAWRKGAEGEEIVGRRLARLSDEWQVLHDLTIGQRGANLDHLVVGPPGVFTLNTKHHTGRVTVYERAILHNGNKTYYVPKALREARRVQTGVSRVLGRDVAAWSVLVFVGCSLDVRKRPSDLTVLPSRRVPKWFAKQSSQRLSASEVRAIAAASSLPQTWSAAGPATSKAPTTASSPKSAASSNSTAGTDLEQGWPGGLTTSRWRRYGHDRLYCNDANGKSLGYLDLSDDTVHIQDTSRVDEVRHVLLSACRNA